jgi:hypothetical protein
MGLAQRAKASRSAKYMSFIKLMYGKRRPGDAPSSLAASWVAFFSLNGRRNRFI